MEIQQTRDHKSLSRSDIDVSNPLAMTCRVMIPASRLPRSMSEMCPRFMSRQTAMSVCVHLFFFRKVWIRFPNWAKSA